MIETFSYGRPVGKIPFFVWRRGSTYANFLRRIYVGGRGGLQSEYLTLLNVYRIPGGICTIFLSKHIVIWAPFPRVISE